MAEAFDSEPDGFVQEHSFTACESLTTDISNDALPKKPTCALVPEVEENIRLDGGGLEKRQEGVCEVSEMEKKEEGFCGDDYEAGEGPGKCALKIEVIDDTALVCAVELSDISQRSPFQEKNDVKGKRVVGFAERCKRNGNNKRNVVQESDGNAKRISGFGGNVGWNGNERMNLMQECDGNRKRIAGSDGKSARNAMDKGYMMQKGDGDGQGISGFSGYLQRNENGQRSFMQESGGNGNELVGFAGTVGKNVMQENQDKKEKRPSRRGKKNCGKNNCHEEEKISTWSHLGAVNLCEGKMGYSRKELEALRFVDVEEQKKKWVEVYCGLGLEIAKEYDGLVISHKQTQKHIHLDFDPRRQFGYQRAASFSGFLAAKGRRYHLGVFVH